MKVVVDNKIPYLRTVLEKFGEVSYLSGSEISHEDIKNADALIIRTRTHCSSELLKDTSLRFIASATIGFDHIDTAYCDSHGIHWTNAPGCNAGSVNQYVVTALLEWASEKNEQLASKTIGIVGVGNVGSKVARSAALLGMKVLLNDPPRERSEGPAGFCSLDEIIQEADIISLHVPLNRTGEDKTLHLVTTKLLKRSDKKPLIINTCRGEVSNTGDLLQALDQNLISDCIIDCWENEPDINPDLLDKAFLATPHIAGYSRDGKANGTAQSVQALSKHFGLSLNNWHPASIEAPRIKDIYLDGKDINQQDIIANAVLSTYNIRQDDINLRNNPKEFESQRGNYPVRREFLAYTLIHKNIPKTTLRVLRLLGFG
ncbi:MAG: 4-phosphoerythronate dehydrogenase PdxB [Bacteroidales bacterium]|nr:4-phosphoerythronate dehydrogenase PdxB [Bacteroidales bacterium]